jgi:hypothetical protein
MMFTSLTYLECNSKGGVLGISVHSHHTIIRLSQFRQCCSVSIPGRHVLVLGVGGRGGEADVGDVDLSHLGGGLGDDPVGAGGLDLGLEGGDGVLAQLAHRLAVVVVLVLNTWDRRNNSMKSC